MKFKIPNVNRIFNALAPLTRRNGCCEQSRSSSACGVGNGSFGCADNEKIKDRGNAPIAFNIRREALENENYRAALWTGRNLQLTVMSIPRGQQTGEEMHDSVDQLIAVVSGVGEIEFLSAAKRVVKTERLDQGSVALIPAGTHHNLKNTGNTSLKLYSVYAPRAHAFGTVDKTRQSE